MPVSPDTLQPLETTSSSTATPPPAPRLGPHTPDSMEPTKVAPSLPTTPKARPAQSTSTPTPSHASGATVLPPTPTSLAPHKRNPPKLDASVSPNPLPVPRKPRIPAITPRATPSSSPVRPPALPYAPPPSTPASQDSYVPIPRVPRPPPRIPAFIKSPSKVSTAPALHETPPCPLPQAQTAATAGDTSLSPFSKLKQRVFIGKRDTPSSGSEAPCHPPSATPPTIMPQISAPLVDAAIVALPQATSFTMPAPLASSQARQEPVKPEVVSEVTMIIDRPRLVASARESNDLCATRDEYHQIPKPVSTPEPTASMDVDNQPPEHPPSSVQDTQPAIPVSLLHGTSSTGSTSTVSIPSQPRVSPQVFRSPSKQPPVIFTPVPDVPRPTAQECVDLETKALNWLRR